MFRDGRVSLHNTSDFSSDLLESEHMAVEERTDILRFHFLGEEEGEDGVDRFLQLTEMTVGLLGIAYLHRVLGVDAVLTR